MIPSNTTKSNTTYKTFQTVGLCATYFHARNATMQIATAVANACKIDTTLDVTPQIARIDVIRYKIAIAPMHQKLILFIPQILLFEELFGVELELELFGAELALEFLVEVALEVDVFLVVVVFVVFFASAIFSSPLSLDINILT